MALSHARALPLPCTPLLARALATVWLPVMHAWYVAPNIWAIFAPIMWTLTFGFGLAVRACLALLVCSLCVLLLLPRLASPVTLAVRADARDVILSICLCRAHALFERMLLQYNVLLEREQERFLHRISAAPSRASTAPRALPAG